MKASPTSILIVAALAFALSLTGLAQAGQYTVQIDSMTAQDAAQGKVQELKAKGLNAYWLKSSVPGQGVRYRVRIGRFANRAAAQSYGTRLKQQGLAAEFFAALYEGTSSPLTTEQAVKKSVPPLPTATVKAQPKPVEKPVVMAPAPTAQRLREVKAPTASSVTNKPVVNTSTTDNVSKPISVPQPQPTVPATNAPPKTVPPAETKPLKITPSLPAPFGEVKPPRDKKVENATDVNVTEAPINKIAASTLPKPVKETVAAAAAPAIASSYLKFEDRSFGYSFERPNYWSGGPLPSEDLQAQRIDAGAIFRSQEDAAFTHAIWNSLKNANSPAYDNNLIVDLVIKSIGNSSGMQGLTETARRLVQEGDQIKTYIDLRTLFRQPRANSPLEFQGKAVIIRAGTGILLVVAFYSKESTPTMIAAAEKIVSSAHVP